ncbi:kinase-like domain-containing protein [Mycena vulgaris]|nr:kinase-like domain-containing protein [Mycena vulgaris]
MASLDPVWSLVQSSQFRVKLLKISSVLGISNDRRLRDALHKDDVDVARLFKLVVNSEVHKKAILRLKGGSAQNCVDLIQDVLDKGSIQKEDDGFTLKARRLLVKLSEASDTLPSSLFIQGVSRLEKEATFGGTFGDIYRASYGGQDVALKRIRVFQRDSARHKIRQRFCREALLWQRLQHPFVLPFTGIDAESFPSFLCMVSPWMRHGTILKHLEENGNANVERRLFEIAQGLAYLHSQNIIHGDLRGSNILVDDEWAARLADFGLAVFSDATAAGTHTSHHGGSVRWMAPELHYPQSCGLDTFQRTFASDVYSFAFVCIEVRSHVMSKPNNNPSSALHRQGALFRYFP